jgi:hypothetical protein
MNKHTVTRSWVSACERRATSDERRFNGSAIILVVVLTSLLAIIGVVFLLTSRVDSIATSAISENKELNLTVDTIIAQISEDLALDVPGVAAQEYYDYPDVNNAWLASLEPNVDKLWPHITNLNYQLGFLAFNMPIDIVLDYQPPAQVGDSNGLSIPAVWFPADADGDGVSDSMWVAVNGISSNKSKHIFAAVRVIDNGGMLNVNTGYKFDPCNADGSSQMQINFAELSQRSVTNGTLDTAAAKLNAQRCNTEPNILYETNVIWQYGEPCGPYTPFDISDELKMRNRYMINQNLIVSRIEQLWDRGFDGPLYVPRKLGDSLDEWFLKANYNSPDPCIYDYRHTATIYNCDRIINPLGGKMVNANTADQNNILAAIRAGLIDANAPGDVSGLAAQITANLIDYVDGPYYPSSDPRYDPNDDVTVVYSGGLPYFGFEQPCIYISEIAQNFFQPDANDANIINQSYAIELYKPYWQDADPNGWHLFITNTNGSFYDTVISWTGSNVFHVIRNDNYDLIKLNFKDANNNNDVNAVPQSNVLDFNSNSLIELRRPVYDPCTSGYIFITVDSIIVPVAGANDTNWLKPQTDPTLKFATKSFQRDITPNKPIRRLWDFFFYQINKPTIGYLNEYIDSDPRVIQAHPANQPFTNVGEFGQLFYNPTYYYGGIGPDFRLTVTEPELRINLADPTYKYQQIFKYLTVMDPRDHNPIDSNETRIKGRININTAPWFVLAQLPWVSYHTQPNYDLARAIVNYRDNIAGPFKSTGELMRVGIGSNDVDSIGYYEGRVVPSVLMMPEDGAGDKFEERDVIFARISNLVTVRSDVFTAYILVRIGQDGPQKRVIAILDRSGVKSSADKVKVLAVYPVPDPR